MVTCLAGGWVVDWVGAMGSDRRVRRFGGGWAAVPSDRGGAVGRGSRREERSGVVRAGRLGSNVSRPILASVYHFGFVFLDSQKIQTKWWQAAYSEGIRGAPRIREWVGTGGICHDNYCF